jgi:RNA polymerase sigma factor (sigma-70 family)
MSSATEAGWGDAGCFSTTHWSVVLAAKEGGSSQTAEALERLCQAYWFPLYAFLRRQGRSPHDAQDLTQEFFARLLRGSFLEKVGPERGRFRSFLLAALKNFLCDEWDKARAQKRGGGQALLSLDDEDAEEQYLLAGDPSETPEAVFDRQWACRTLERALSNLRAEFEKDGQAREFDCLKIFLSTSAGDGGYNETAARLGIAPDRVALKVHRLRRRYGELIRAEIAQTVVDARDIGAELQHLLNAIGR